MTSQRPSSSTSVAASHTASVIPFPARRTPAAPAHDQRLARALESLNAALAAQKVAIGAWRDVLGELRATTAGLDESLQHYRASLRSLGTSVSALKAKAESLERWSERAATAE